MSASPADKAEVAIPLILSLLERNAVPATFFVPGRVAERYPDRVREIVAAGHEVGNARLAEASLAEEVAAALDATDNHVAIGGAGLAAQAIELGLVDELRMFRNPVIVGGGTPFFPPVTDDIALELIETRTFGSRVIYERYRRARDESE